MYRDTNCKLQAHRGVSTDRPENTMEAFREAVRQGYDIIEFDPKVTKDGVIVVLHDNTLNRTARIAGNKLTEEKVAVGDLSFAELSDIDVGEWFAPEYTGEHIPTFSQALDYMRSAGIEAKVDNIVQKFSDENIEKVFDIIEKHGGKTGLTCSDLSVLGRFAKRFPDAPLHYDGVVNDESLDTLGSFSAGHETTVWARLDTPLSSWCKVPPADKALADKIHARGYKLGIWILIDDAEMKRALEFGADIVETTGGIKP